MAFLLSSSMSFSLYNFTGLFSSFFILLALSGIIAQLGLVLKRKKLFKNNDLPENETPTSILSLNRFSTSFIATFAMFLYGLTMQTMDMYIAAPRFAVVACLLLIVFEIWYDRRDKTAEIILFGSIVLVMAAIAFSFTPYRTALTDLGLSQTLVVVSTVLLLQGGYHQVYKIRKSGRTGALSLKMHQLFFVKDLSSIIFGLVLGFHNGWPVIVFHSSSLMLQFATMYHFYWVKHSPLASERRL